MANRRKPEFSLTADLEKFKYEVADEISINNKRHRGVIPAAKPDNQQSSQ